MPKNTGKGGKNRKRGTNKNEATKRELVTAEDGQSYALVTKMLGHGRCSCQCVDGKMRLAVIRGKLRKKVWVNNGDIILISLRSFQDDKVDIIGKYRPEEVEKLVKQNQIPESFQRDTGSSEATGGYVTFAHDEDDAPDEAPAMKKRSAAGVYEELDGEEDEDEEDYEVYDEEDEDEVEEEEPEEEPEEDPAEVTARERRMRSAVKDKRIQAARSAKAAGGGGGGWGGGGGGGGKQPATAAAALAGGDIDIDAI